MKINCRFLLDTVSRASGEVSRLRKESGGLGERLMKLLETLDQLIFPQVSRGILYAYYYGGGGLAATLGNRLKINIMRKMKKGKRNSEKIASTTPEKKIHIKCGVGDDRNAQYNTLCEYST